MERIQFFNGICIDLSLLRVGKGFSRVETPLFKNMLVVRAVDAEEEVQVLNKCSALVLRVEGLENANAAQQLEIIKLKARVKKLERLNKERMSVDMETDEGIELEVDQEKDAEEDTEVQEAVEFMTTAKLITKVVTAAATQSKRLSISRDIMDLRRNPNLNLKHART
nr:hypothetical protein [Tanacetum cinerariifolium]